jgi:Domain of unknown function (DUF222)
MGERNTGSGARIAKALSEELSDLQRESACVQRRMLSIIAEWDRLELWRSHGCPDMVQWVSGRFNISHYDARLRINCALALEILPHIDKAFSAGELSLEKTVQLTRFATPKTEEELIPWARRVQPSTIRNEADRRQRAAIEEIRRAHTGRYLTWCWSDDRSLLYFEGALPHDRGIMFVNAIKELVKEIPAIPEEDLAGLKPDSSVLYERRCADALSAIVSTRIDDGTEPGHATVVVHTKLSDLTGSDETECGTIMHPSITEKLMCDGRLQHVLTDGEGNALGIGYESRNIPRWLKRQVKHRDKHCTFPGCHHRYFVDAHHVVHWPKGPTDLDNLVLVCSFHHDLIHKFGWKVKLEGSKVTWFDPSGSEFLPGPDPPVKCSA